MKNIVLMVILCVFAQAKDICQSEIAQNEIKMANENKKAFSNEIQTFLGAKCENGKIYYDYIYTPKYSINLEKIDENMKSQRQVMMKNMLRAMYCDMPEFKEQRQANLILHYTYHTQNINKFYEVEISRKDCKN